MNTRVFAATAMLVALWNTPATAVQVQLSDVQPCLDAPDRPFCILRLFARTDGGQQLVRDPDLRAHPQVLAAVGVSLEAAEAQQAEDRRKIAAEHTVDIYGPSDRAAEAARAALLLDRQGRSPAEALAPVEALPLTPRVLPGIYATPPESARLLAYALLGGGWAPKEVAPSASLVAASLSGWERSLYALQGHGNLLSGPMVLAQAYQRLGDKPAMARVLNLDPDQTPDQQITALVSLGLLDEAAAASGKAARDGVGALESAFQRRFLAAQAQGDRVRAELEQRARAALIELRAKSSSAQERRAIDEALRGGGREGAAAEPAPSSDQLRSEGLRALREARAALIRAAAKASRRDLEREVADQVLAQAAAEKPMPALGADVIGNAEPKAATAYVEQMEAALRPYREGGRDTLEVQTDFSAVSQDWKALGRRDRVDALLARWTSEARREVERKRQHPNEAVQTPYAFQIAQFLLGDGNEEQALALGALEPSDFLRFDIDHGRGVTRLPKWLEGTSTPFQKISLYITCRTESELKRAFDDALLCLRDAVPLEDTAIRKQSLAYEGARLAGYAARGDRPDIAVTALRIASEIDAAVPANERGRFSSLSSFDFVEVAKAELRAAGKLPPKPLPPLKR